MKIKPKIFDELRSALYSFGDKYLVGEELNRSKLSDSLRNYDESLLKKLFQVDFIKQHFIKEVAGQKLFQIEQLEEAILYNDYWDTSYTKYENRIGLASKGKFLEDSQDVVLDFPFKDGVLTASMTKEDNEEGYDDSFLNEVIEKDEIDRLFDKKIFVNSKRYDENGESTVTEFNKDEDNLIIKGNNLLALHAIKEKYVGSVKLIYIDVPYNTGSDSFKYNDRFNQSSWLTFIKNRVEVAQDFLSDDGVILIQISFHQYPYLRVLLDDVLGKNHHVMDINTLVRHPQRTLTGDKEFNDVIEHTLVYSKNSEFKMPKIAEKKTVDKYKFHVSIKEKPTETRIMGKKEVEIYLPDSFEITKVIPNSENLHRETVRGSIREKNSSGRFYVAYLEKLREEFPPLTLFKVPDMGDDSLGFRYFELPKEGNKNGAYYQGMPQSSEYTYKPYPNFLDFVEDYNSVNEEGGYEYRNGKKPEEYIDNYMKMFTDENDLVMDFFMGSGTTQSVALKTSRRFIGIEQLEDTMENVTIPRLQNVISGDGTGISTKVNWQGGGSFIYIELMPKNMGYLQDIIHSKTLDELKIVYNRMLEGTGTMEPADISFRADLDKIDWLEGFNENKRLLIKLLDKNGLYYNYSEIDDANVRELISDDDYSFNKQFYKGGE
ncbi:MULTISPECIES: DNA methyltransferase [Lactococcus]|uniref:DNA methyltransferase n=5 Tax=Streptococcaceae TaxID=1300 RepID=A0AAJ6MJS6_LACLC|nr:MULTISPECIES: DNA methyltransferase [Lactococcus]QEX49799.1 Type III restriction-modification system methylation subunit [Lactococcus lactis subsp. lactis bv. diacetylactis]QTP69784.1 site-specific DNA-methyltransferase [Lactococcus lactis subsp. lactis bv. diacetylactis]WOW94818.1 DNA methyltransferase [Lactococcus cremoris]